jgi:hypothetical protein
MVKCNIFSCPGCHLSRKHCSLLYTTNTNPPYIYIYIYILIVYVPLVCKDIRHIQKVCVNYVLYISVSTVVGLNNGECNARTGRITVCITLSVYVRCVLYVSSYHTMIMCTSPVYGFVIRTNIPNPEL